MPIFRHFWTPGFVNPGLGRPPAALARCTMRVRSLALPPPFRSGLRIQWADSASRKPERRRPMPPAPSAGHGAAASARHQGPLAAPRGPGAPRVPVLARHHLHSRAPPNQPRRRQSARMGGRRVPGQKRNYKIGALWRPPTWATRTHGAPAPAAAGTRPLRAARAASAAESWRSWSDGSAA